MTAVLETEATTEVGNDVDPIRARRARAALAMGQDITAMGVRRADFTFIADGGVLMDVDFYGYGCVERRLSEQEFERVYGVTLPPEAKAQEIATFANLFLLPGDYRRALRRPNDRLRAVVSKYAVDLAAVRLLTGHGNYFVPLGLAATLAEAEREQQQALAATIDAIATDWGRIETAMRESFLAMAERARRSLRANDRGRKLPTTKRYAAAVVEALMPLVPTPETLRARLRLVLQPRVIAPESEIVAEARRLQEERARLTAAQEEERIVVERIRIATEDERTASWERARVRREQAETQLRLVRLRAQEEAAAIQARQERQTAEQQLKLAAFERNVAEAINPAVDCLYQVVRRVRDDARAMLGSVEHNQQFHASTVAKAKEVAVWWPRMVGWAQGANLPTITEISTMVEELGALAEAPRGRGARPVESVQAVLEDLAAVCAATTAGVERALGEETGRLP